MARLLTLAARIWAQLVRGLTTYKPSHPLLVDGERNRKDDDTLLCVARHHLSLSTSSLFLLFARKPLEADGCEPRQVRSTYIHIYMSQRQRREGPISDILYRPRENMRELPDLRQTGGGLEERQGRKALLKNNDRGTEGLATIMKALRLVLGCPWVLRASQSKKQQRKWGGGMRTTWFPGGEILQTKPLIHGERFGHSFVTINRLARCSNCPRGGWSTIIDSLLPFHERTCRRPYVQ